MLHNMLLEYDGLNDINWENIDPDDDVIEEEVDQAIDEQVPLNPLLNNIVEMQTYVPYHSFQYDKIREALKDHFYLLWPKKLSER